MKIFFWPKKTDFWAFFLQLPGYAQSGGKVMEGEREEKDRAKVSVKNGQFPWVAQQEQETPDNQPR